MLTIRNEQMEVLNNALRREYVQRVAAIFARRYPQKFTGGTEQAASFVESNIPKALKYGIASELHVATFLNFLILHGEDFESRPECAWAVDILNSREGTGDDRVEWLETRLQTLNAINGTPAKG
ncbi:MAG TPA: hypothetical protein VFA65_18790 [Bryobacteraceae bacterium]|nr:hypothetical protein [Bryobacteraceae bacterium]